MAGQPTKLAELYSKASALAARQEDEMERIVKSLVPVLAWLNEPVTLRPGALGESFQGLSSVTLETGAMVVMVDYQGEVSSQELGSFRSEDMIAILNDAFPELQRMAANRRRALQIRPQLSLKIVLGGSHLLLDRRSYRLRVSNSGGDCVALSSSILSPEGSTEASRPCDVARGAEAEVDLGVYREIEGMGRVELAVECRDSDGRDLVGREWVPIEGREWKEVLLKRKN
jgi:hypothetical protein